MAKKVLVDGLDLNVIGKRLSRYGINDLDVQLLRQGLLLMQADVSGWQRSVGYQMHNLVCGHSSRADAN